MPKAAFQHTSFGLIEPHKAVLETTAPPKLGGAVVYGCEFMMGDGGLFYTSHLTPHTSHLTPHTSHLTPHTSILQIGT
ncbi:hypothetical protein BDK62_101554 [Halomonas alkaliantarctica]|nr:hypothetical protein BDK62_101554 [Halomonas alkaliantarctica]